MQNFLGGDFTFQKIYIFLEFFLFFLRGGGDGRPKNGGMEMDNPKNGNIGGFGAPKYPPKLKKSIILIAY